jgi:pimeloyl-ACP methyl ester carboxylesterase
LKGPRAAAIAAAFTLCCAAADAAPVEEIVQLPSAGGAVLPYLHSRDAARNVKVAAILFAGSGGNVGLRQRGIPKPGGNFLVRSRKLFVDLGIAIAVIDAPSDVASMSDGFRSGARHARDVGTVVADLKQRHPGVRVFLVGTSRGTVSAAHAGVALGAEVAGVVLTSSVFKAGRGGTGLSGFDYASIPSPLLLVHHVDDGCPATPYWEAQTLSKKVPLISVSGGEPARSEPCEAFSAHGYLGVEAPTVAAISRWMLGLEFPRTVP